MIPATIDSVGNPGMPVPFGGIGVVTDDCVATTEVVLLTVMMFVVVDVTDDTMNVVDDDTVETMVDTTNVFEIPANGANLRIVDSGCDVAMQQEPVLTVAN